MTVLKTFAKDPDTTERIGLDWSARLDTATLSTASWSATPSGLTLSGATTSTTAATTLVTGGVLGTTYRLTCRITTSDNQTLDATVAVVIQPT